MNGKLGYYQAVIAMDIDGREKLALFMMIHSMDYRTRETYIGTKRLGEKMGMGYSSAKRAMDELERLKLIEFLYMRQVKLGTPEATKVYRILVQPLEVKEEQEWGQNERGGGVNLNGGVKTADNNIQSAVGGGSGVSAKQSGGADSTHTYTHTDSLDETPYGEDQNKNQTPRFSDEEIKILRTLLGELTGIDSEAINEDSLRDYTGPFGSTRLAFLMFYAFRISKYWKVPSNWIALDMENFLGASRKLDGEIRKWRQHDSLVKKFPTAQSVLDKVVPPAPPSTGRSRAFEIEDDNGHVWEFAEDFNEDRCNNCGCLMSQGGDQPCDGSAVPVEKELGPLGQEIKDMIDSGRFNFEDVD